MNDIQTAVKYLTAAAEGHVYWRYYDGDQQLKWSHDSLKRVFGSNLTGFKQNWCGVVVRALTDRLDLERVVVPNDDIKTQALDDIMTDNDLLTEAADIHRDVAVYGVGYVVAWPNEQGEIEFYRQSPEQIAMIPDPERPKRTLFAAKWFDEPARRVMTLYYPDRVETYYTTTDNFGEAGNWSVLDEPVANPFGRIPVFRFGQSSANQRSVLVDAIPIQDLINKSVADMVVTAEFAAFPQRWAITNATLEENQVKAKPNTIMQLPPSYDGDQPTSIGAFPASDLGNYLGVIDNLVDTMAAITQIPKHVFRGNPGQVSGEALIAMEAPLVKKARMYQQALGQTWEELAMFALEVAGHSVEECDAVWAEPATVQPATEAQVLATKVGAGIPLVTLLKRAGWTEEEIDQMLEDGAMTPAATKPTDVNATPDAVAAEAVAREVEIERNMKAMAEQTLTLVRDAVLSEAFRTGLIDRVIQQQAVENAN